ncbi:MAG: EF-Tu/IF-2/RF-3 family GTPase, partial [Oscillospiraceae bacterium]
ADFYKILAELKASFGPTVCPIVVPIVENGKIVCYVNLIEMKAYTYNENGEAVECPIPESEYRLEGLIAAVGEAVAETDEALFEKFFSGEQFTQKELIKGIHDGMNAGIITPVTCVSSTTLAGVDMLMKEITLLLPAPVENDVMLAEKDGETVEVAFSENEPLCAFVFKTVADAFVGKISFIKVISGQLKTGMDIVNASNGQTEKVGKLLYLCGKKQEEISSANTGEIVAATKMSVNTNDTICDPSRVVSLEKIEFPIPTYRMTVKAKAQGDESKISQGILRLLDEDKTLTYTQDENTKEQILSGLGEQHLSAALVKLKNDFGVDIDIDVPRIPYRETIRKKVKVQGRHKKQSGGHGQYGDVWIEFEPCMSDELVFEEKVFGGSVPKNFFP